MNEDDEHAYVIKGQGVRPQPETELARDRMQGCPLLKICV